MLGLQVSIATLMDILPGAAAQPLHRDDAMYRGLPYPHIPLTVNTVITLDDFTLANGATVIVPHSKDLGEEIDQEQGRERAVPAVCAAGSLIAWSGSTWHGEKFILAAKWTRPHRKLHAAGTYRRWSERIGGPTARAQFSLCPGLAQTARVAGARGRPKRGAADGAR